MKRFLKRHWPLLGVVILLFVVALYFARAGQDLLRTTALLKDFISGEGVKLKDIHYRQDDPDEKIKWVLDAREVLFSEDRKTIRFYDFRLEVEPEGKPRFSLTGKRGTYQKDQGKIELWENLEGSYGKQYRFLTEYLWINEKEASVKTEKPIEIYGTFFEIKGVGLFADLDKERINVLSNVKTILYQEDMAQ